MKDVPKDTIIRAAEGDMNAFEEIYRIASSYVYTIAFRVTSSREDAQEVTQDVFLSVHKNLKKFQFKSSFKTWIYRITTNTAINAYRKRSKERGRKVSFDDDISTHDPAETKMEQTFDMQHNEALVRAMLAGLPSDQRVCVILKDIEGLKYKEVAVALKIKINTVRSRLKRAREKLMFQRKKKR